MVDLGAGTGQFNPRRRPGVCWVVAVNVSPVMLERLRAKAAASAVDNVEMVHAGFLTYEHLGPPAYFMYSR